MDDRAASLEGRWQPRFLGRTAHLLFVLVACALATHWLQQSIHHYLPKDWSQAHEYDGLEDWTTARFYLEAKNPYTPASLAERNLTMLGHPPTTAFWFIPLGFLEKSVAAELMDSSTWLLLLLQLYLCARELKFPAPVALAVLLFAWMLTTDGMTMHWHAIQISEQISFPLTLCWLYLRRNRDWSAGVALGAAATFKLFPGILMLFLLFARRFRAFAAAVGLYLAIAAFMTATYGFASWPMFVKLQETVSKAWLGNIRNASLQGIVLRLTSAGDVVVPTRKASVIAALVGVVLLVVAGALSRRAVKASRQGDPRLIDLPFALFTVLAVFLNPWVWEHYFVLMIQPAFVLADSLHRAFRRSLRAWLDEETPHGALARDGAAFVGVATSLVVIGSLLGTNAYAKTTLEPLWKSHQTPWYYHHLRVAEILNCLPWIILLVACYFAVWYLSPGAADDASHVRAP